MVTLTTQSHPSSVEMFPAVSLLLLCVLAVTAKPVVVRDSPITLPIVRKLNLKGEATIADIDRARVQGFRDRSIATVHGASAAAAVLNVPVTNGLVQYTASVRRLYSLIIFADQLIFVCRSVSVPRQRTVRLNFSAIKKHLSMMFDNR